MIHVVSMVIVRSVEYHLREKTLNKKGRRRRMFFSERWQSTLCFRFYTDAGGYPFPFVVGRQFSMKITATADQHFQVTITRVFATNDCEPVWPSGKALGW